MKAEYETKSLRHKSKSLLFRHIINASKLLIAVGLVYWLIKSGRLDFALLLRLLTPWYLTVCLLLCLSSLLTNSYRWFILLQAQNFKVTFGAALRLTFIGQFFNIAMPGGVGGDLIKGYYLVKDNAHRKLAAATSVLLDRLIGFFSMTVVSMVSLVLNLELIQKKQELVVLATTTTLLFFSFVVLFLTAFSGRVRALALRFFNVFPGGEFFQKFYTTLGTYRENTPALFRAMVVSLVTQCLTIAFFVVVGEALGTGNVPWQAYIFVVPLGLIAMSAPIAPAGIGVGQAAFFVLFNWYLGYESQLGPAAITAYQIVMITLGLLGAYFYFQRKTPLPIEGEL